MLASGLPTGSKDFEAGTLLYTFKQNVPIPSYLFAIASGDIATASIGPRSVVATGPEELCSAKWELEDDMEKFIEAAEVEARNLRDLTDGHRKSLKGILTHGHRIMYSFFQHLFRMEVRLALF